MGLLNAVAELRQLARELAPIHGVQQHLGGAKALVRHRPPLRIGAEQHVAITEWGCSAGSRFPEVWVPEGGDHGLLVPGPDHTAGRPVLYPGLGGFLLEPAGRAPDRPITGLDNAFVAANERRKGYGLGRGKRQVAAGAVADLTVADPTPEPPPGSVLPIVAGTLGRARHRADQATIRPDLVAGRALVKVGGRFPLLGLVRLAS